MCCCLYLAFHWILSPEPNIPIYPLPLVEDLLLNVNFLQPNKIEWLRQTMRVSHSTVLTVASATVGQQKNPMWMALRKYRFTASKFGDLIKAVSKQRYLQNFIELGYA